MRPAISSSCVRDLWGDRRGLLLILWLTLHLMLAFLSWSLRIRCLSESLRILAPSLSLPFCALVSMGVRWVFSTEVFQCDGVSWQLHAGVIPACRVAMDTFMLCLRCQAPVQLLRHQFPSSSIDDEFNFRQNICNSFLPVILLLSILSGCVL